MAFLTISKLVTRSTVSKPATRLYPFEKREPFPRTRGHVKFEIGNCVFCNLCAKKCPTDAIVCDRKTKVWEINHLACVLCGNCVDSCRKGCLTQVNVPAKPMTKKEVEHFQVETQTPEELEAEQLAMGKKPASSDDCCSNE
jgi:formate hydrogenlyase subunit 6/NADH:ubiquinone oxidoreductase subunit I